MAYHGAAFGSTGMREIMRRKHRLSSQTLVQTFGVLSILCSVAAGAQFNQYQALGRPQDGPETSETCLRGEIAEERYHLGPLRIAPGAGIKAVAYVRNPFDASGSDKGDVTAA